MTNGTGPQAARLGGQTVGLTKDTRHTFAEWLDVWNLRDKGDWVDFEGILPGFEGARAWRRHGERGPIFARNLDPLFGIFALAGPRAGMSSGRVTRFPYHVFSTPDDIGHVGMGGMDEAAQLPGLGTGREVTTCALAAETILAVRQQAQLSLPLFYTRSEIDSAPDWHGMATGLGMTNLRVAVENWIETAKILEKPARLLGVLVDFGLEDLSGSDAAFVEGAMHLLEALRTGPFSCLPLPPQVVSIFETGTQTLTDHPALTGQWKLALDHGLHNFTYAAPGYMFKIDAHGWLTDRGRSDRGAMVASAMLAGINDQRWRCPVLYLAEADDCEIHVTAQSDHDLVLDTSDPFGAGPHFGFRLLGAENGARIDHVALDPTHPESVIVTCDKPPKGTDLQLAYAAGADPEPNRDFPANCGALRDKWSLQHEGRVLHRWALPACLKVT